MSQNTYYNPKTGSFTYSERIELCQMFMSAQILLAERNCIGNQVIQPPRKWETRARALAGPRVCLPVSRVSCHKQIAVPRKPCLLPAIVAMGTARSRPDNSSESKLPFAVATGQNTVQTRDKQQSFCLLCAFVPKWSQSNFAVWNQVPSTDG